MVDPYNFLDIFLFHNVLFFFAVVNVNDNPPKIINSNSTFQVSQNVIRNTLVGKVIAQDNDGDQLKFMIISREWDIQRTFSMDQYTGNS